MGRAIGGHARAATLENLKNWMARNNAAVMRVLVFVIGVKMIGAAISGFPA